MQPVTQSGRYIPLDILRGAALLGVLLVNLLTLFRVSLFAQITGTAGPATAIDGVVSAIVYNLIEFKAFTLFSFLFGAGIAVQQERQSRPAAFLARRFLVLLAIGLTHIVFIWNGDILTLYAVCGLLAIPLLGFPSPALAVVGGALILIAYYVPMPIAFPSTEVMKAQAVEATRVYATGGFAEIQAFRWSETTRLIVPLLLLSLPKTLGVMLLGVAAWRSHCFTKRRELWLPVLLISAAAGLAGIFLHIEMLAQIPLAFAYAAALLLWVPKAPLLAAGGQMALTNYLTESVVFSLVFYGFGLGLMGRVGITTAAAGGLAFYVAQLFCSRFWLRHFHFGPVEWLWRSLTYGRRQPMLKNEVTVSRAGARVITVLVFLVGAPAVHLGVPWLISRISPRWGPNWWGLCLVALGMAGLVWLLTASLGEIAQMPEPIKLGLRPARLVQTGPYSYARHPMYVAELLLWLGVALYAGSPVVLAVMVTGAVIARYVISIEERALESYFGGEYRSFRERVPFFPDFKAHPPAGRHP